MTTNTILSEQVGLRELVQMPDRAMAFQQTQPSAPLASEYVATLPTELLSSYVVNPLRHVGLELGGICGEQMFRVEPSSISHKGRMLIMDGIIFHDDGSHQMASIVAQKPRQGRMVNAVRHVLRRELPDTAVYITATARQSIE